MIVEEDIYLYIVFDSGTGFFIAFYCREKLI